MQKFSPAVAMALTLALALASAAPAAFAAPSPAVTAALADPGRPAADKARDADRKAAEVVEFTEVKPGDKVADIFPGGGYFTHIFSKVVGPNGHVYTVFRDAQAGAKSLGANAALPNVKVVGGPWDQFSPPEKLDVIFNSQFYHDLYNPKYGATGGGPEGVARTNKAIFDALKPGGLYVVVDHAGRPGTGYSEMDTLHRIEEPTVKEALIKAGFVPDGESQALRNPADPRTANVFDASIRGKTDQFILRFRKPK